MKAYVERSGFHEHVVSMYRLAAVFIAACMLLLPCGLTAAQAQSTACAYQTIDIDKYGKKPFQNPPDIRSNGNTLATTLTVTYTNPLQVSLADCPLRLRTYDGQLVGPTLRVQPGDVLDIALTNQLPVETPDQIAGNFQEEAKNAHLGQFPASYNTTNLHTHGLHVSPGGNSDNVLLNIPPGATFPYEIRTPPNHTRGSYWYHAHAHGSTSIQVGSGMAGALIIEDDPAQISSSLRAANATEKIMILQTILYNTRGELDQITALFPSGNCSQSGNEGTWDCSKRVVTINGQITPVITMRPGEVQRWRLIDSAFRQGFDLRLEGHALNEIALDGIYLGRVDTWPEGQTISLQPGYRSDVLIQASKTPGTYRLINGALPPQRALRAVAQPEQVIAILNVEGQPMDMSLPTNAEMAKIAPFPNTDLRTTAIGVQQVTFKLGKDLSPTNSRNYFQVDFQAFDHERIRKVVLDQTEQWTLTTVGDPANIPKGIPPVAHVFHIHVNPFQIVRKDPGGADELVWKDTIIVPPNPDGKSPAPQVNIYTRYTDYVGKFVLHCHILDHEDLGMMEVVEVVEPEAVNMRLRMQHH